MTSRQRIDALLRTAVHAAKVGLWDWDVRNNSVVFSAEWKSMLGYSEDEIRDDFAEWERRVHPEDLPRMTKLLADYLAKPWPDYSAEFRMQHQDGSWRWLLTQADLILDSQGRPEHMIGSHIDITDRKRVEAELGHANRKLRVLNESNQALIRATDEATLLADACRIAVDIGGYRMAWVGLVDPHAVNRVRPSAHAGFDDGYLAAVGAAPAGSLPGQCLAAVAIETGEPRLARNLSDDAAFAAHREAAAQRGYRSAIALPLIADAHTIGALEIYSAETDAIDTSEMTILTEFARDVARGISVLRIRAERDLATGTLRDTERQIRTLIDHFPDFVSRFDTQGRIVYVSPSVVRNTGRSEAEMLGHTPLELGVCTDAEQDALLQESASRVVASGCPEKLDVDFRTLTGTRPFEVRHVPEKDAMGRVVSVLEIAADMTERKKAERQLYLLNYALDNVDEGLFLMEDDSPQFSYVNQSAVDSLGYARDALTGGMGIADIDPEWSTERWEAFLPELHLLRRKRIETTHRAADGRTMPVEVTGNHFEFEGRHHTLAIVRDISERKAAEKALRESETEYRALADNTPDLIVRWDRKGTRVYVNPAFAEAVDLPAERIIGTRLGSQYSSGVASDNAASLADLAERIEATFGTGQAMAVELPFNGWRGWRVVEYRLVPERGPDGAIITVLGIGRDITEQKLAEAAVQAREREYRALADNTPDFVVRWDRDLRRVYVNPAFAATVGIPPEQIGGSLVGSHDPAALAQTFDGTAEILSERVTAVFDSGQPSYAELLWIGPDGKRTIDLRLVPERGANGAVTTVLGIGRDISTLKETERQLRTLTDHSPDIIIRFDAEGRYLYANAAFEKLVGVPLHAHLGRPFGEVTALDLPTTSPATYQALRQRIMNVAATHVAAEAELELPLVDGSHAFNVRFVPELSESGKVESVLVVARDVTMRRKLEEQLRQAQKMEAVGQLAGGIAHDFNNMLAVMQLQAALLLDVAEQAPEIRDGLQEILTATERASSMTRQLLTFSRREVAQPVELDLGNALGSMTRLLRRLLGEQITLETRFAPTLPLIFADPGMMEQVLMNLAINARDAMPEGGRLSITLDSLTIDEPRILQLDNAGAAPFVRLSVHDTGIGIPEEHLSRIFEPFFTTKEIGRGTGLGLATVFGIVQEHDGWVEVRSEVGHGTTFDVLLPALDRGIISPLKSEPPSTVPGGSETILLVEDEPTVRALCRATLERYGYRVREAGSAPEAIRVWEASDDAPDLLLTDLILPGGMSGRELADALVKRSPNLKVVYSSGYSPDVVSRLLHLDASRRLLRKPFIPVDLARTVRNCLDEGV